MSNYKPRGILAYWGGTAGSGNGDNGATPKSSAEEQYELVLRKYPSVQNLYSELTLVNMGQKDSTNMDQSDRHRNVDLIQAATNPSEAGRLGAAYPQINGKYDFVVIQQGTDSMSESAAYSSFFLLDNTPVVFTGARKKYTDPGTDAIDNLRGALVSAANPNLSGRYLFFGNRLLWGPRAVKMVLPYRHSDGFSFYTPDYPVFGFIDQGTLNLTNLGSGLIKNHRERMDYFLNRLGGPFEVRKYPQQILDWAETKELTADFNPNIWEPFIRNYKDFILSARGSGGVERISRGTDVHEMIHRLADNGTDIWIDSKVPGMVVDKEYEVNRAPLISGGLPLPWVSREAAKIKLNWANAISFNQNSTGEITPDHETVRRLMYFSFFHTGPSTLDAYRDVIDISKLEMSREEAVEYLAQRKAEGRTGSVVDNDEMRRFRERSKRFDARESTDLVYKLISKFSMQQLDVLLATNKTLLEQQKRAESKTSEPGYTATPATEQYSSKPLNVLVVDDRKDTLDIMKLTLEQKGYRVYDAATYEDALRISKEHEIDIGLFDVLIGHEDGRAASGVDLAEQLSSEGKHMDAFFMSASPDHIKDLEKQNKVAFDKNDIQIISDRILDYYLSKRAKG